jgi:hypothetical protein
MTLGCCWRFARTATATIWRRFIRPQSAAQSVQVYKCTLPGSGSDVADGHTRQQECQYDRRVVASLAGEPPVVVANIPGQQGWKSLASARGSSGLSIIWVPAAVLVVHSWRIGNQKGAERSHYALRSSYPLTSHGIITLLAFRRNFTS